MGRVLTMEETRTETAASSVLSRLFAGGVVLGDGAMGTMLCERGISVDRCLDELNLSQPDMVASVHSKYLQSGADIIETNTFGANAHRLQRFGLQDKMQEINLAGVQVARKAGGKHTCIAGAVGPLGVRLGEISPDGMRSSFAGQIAALVEGGPGVGVDLLLVETMMSLTEAVEAIRAAREMAPDLRLVVTMTVDEAGNCLDGASAETAAARLTEFGVDAVGCNCSFGPESVLRAIQRMRGATHLPLTAMPNAGLPQTINGRSVYCISPEEMAAFALRAIDEGANLIGGCCGTTPEHIKAMWSAVQTRPDLESTFRDGVDFGRLRNEG
jgi:methionine synthase / methylenetetrahydrofolate reductase(NADPH)